ncbi:AGE family epimerase/isomerase, partial [Candidatus Bipolaricaulota bacterium]|nr:AGE family epimerase/isomerase [Candidatus Bipolaricaulota bacterium]
AYTGLLRVWDNARLREQLNAIIHNFVDKIIDGSTGHMLLFFDEQWRSLSETVSFGHDIEASWLLQEAAEASGDPDQLEQAKRLAVLLATAVMRDGLDGNGSLFSESTPQGMLDDGKDWWPQAEAVVGFHNAYELTGDASFADAAFRCWRYIQEEFVDRTHGDWFKRLDLDGTPDPKRHKSGPWECPYHHSRMCLEMLNRLDSSRERV